jgi:hypothetical protein
LSDKECKLTFEEFIHKYSNMSARPGHYAGRGPMTCDLNDQHLEKFHEGLIQEVGAEAARNFVMMVEELEDMSATAFLWSFMRFWPNKRWTNQKAEKGDGVTISGYGDAAFMEAEVCVLNVLSDRRDLGQQAQESQNIKRGFLMRHGVRPVKMTTVYNDGFGNHYRDDYDFPYGRRRKH